MTDGIRPVSAVERRERRAAERRAAERRASSTSRELVPLGEAADHAPGTEETPARPAPKPGAETGAAAFAAQMIGQTGQRKGLKGGPPVLGAARSTYLGTEYSGAKERRPGAGKSKRTDV
ncbi:hypothetical protein [uncultured Brevundimonas sp.]|uniref:hypothetical protein n=1 Tax=uncultured Brevundimonas sp. TaxID=213418 RepID=UPI0030EBDDC9